MMRRVPDTDQVCAVIVSHDAGLRIQRVVETLSEQVGHIVIVDNASSPFNLAILDDLRERRPDLVTLILNDANRWMAAALNQGIAWADRRGYAYVLFSSDQDNLTDGSIPAMLDLFGQPRLGRVGTVNPRVILGSDVPQLDEDAPARDWSLPVTGGCLASIEALRVVGPQREEFLIDFVDYDFALRMQAAGYQTLQLPSAALVGELGQTTTRRFLWRTCAVNNYSPSRRYYFARNGLTLVRETGHPELRRFYVHFLVTSIVKILIYENDKIPKLRMIGRGLRDSLRGQLGPLDPIVE